MQRPPTSTGRRLRIIPGRWMWLAAIWRGGHRSLRLREPWQVLERQHLDFIGWVKIPRILTARRLARAFDPLATQDIVAKAMAARAAKYAPETVH